jgi:hypothetical protein
VPFGDRVIAIRRPGPVIQSGVPARTLGRLLYAELRSGGGGDVKALLLVAVTALAHRLRVARGGQNGMFARHSERCSFPTATGLGLIDEAGDPNSISFMRGPGKKGIDMPTIAANRFLSATLSGFCVGRHPTCDVVLLDVHSYIVKQGPTYDNE